MTSPSPICLVNGLSSAAGTDTTAGATVTVQLADLTGVTTWELTCLYTDEANTAAAVQATIVITNPVTKTATFTMPATVAGSAVIMQSKVNGGVDVNGRTQASYSTNFEVHVLNGGLRLFAVNETTETGAYGWMPKMNAAIKAAATAGGATAVGAANTVQTTDGSGVLQGATNVLAGTSYVSIGTTPSSTGNIRGGSDLLITHNVGGVDRNVLDATSGADIIIGDPTNGSSIINRTPSAGNIYHQVGGVNQLTVQSDGTHFNTYPAIFGATPATAGDMRFPKNSTVQARNDGGTADLTIWENPLTTNNLWIGTDSATTSTKQFNTTILGAGATVGIVASTSTVAQFTTTDGIRAYTPIITVGSSGAATTGNIRLGNAHKALFRNAAGTNDISIFETTSGDSIWIGIDSATTVAKTATNIWMYSASHLYFGTNGSQKMSISTTDAIFDTPIISNQSLSVLTSFIGLGTSQSATGDIRLSSGGGSIKFRNAGNTADELLISVTPGSDITIGNLNANQNQYYKVGNGCHHMMYVNNGGDFGWMVGGSNNQSGFPIIGNSGQPSPYGVHGVGTQAMADANQTVAAAIYCYNTIATTGAITANRNLTLPAATDAAGYTKIIDNRCTGAFSVIVKDSGAGTTVTVANGTIITVLMDSRGATQVGVAAGGSGSFTAPTGTGLMTVTSGTMDSASSAVGTGVLTFLGTPSSANLASAITDETGSGALVFGTSPTFTTSIAVGTTPSTTGLIQLPAATDIKIRNAANSADISLIHTASDSITIGNQTSIASAEMYGNNARLWGTTSAALYNTSGSGFALEVTSTKMNIGSPLVVTTVDTKGTNTDRQPVHVQTTDATVTTLDSFTLASGTMVACSWLVSCIQSTSATAGAFSVTACFRNNGGTVAQVGTTQVTVLGSDDAAYTCTIDNSTTTIRLRVTGKAATTLQWTGVATCLTVIP